MEFTEKDVFEAMGLTPPEEEPGAQQEPTRANEPGAAAPAAEETTGTPEGGDTGTTGGEGAEGAVTAPEGQDGADGADNNDAGDAEGAKKEQTPDERRAHAAARRRAEQQAAGDAARRHEADGAGAGVWADGAAHSVCPRKRGSTPGAPHSPAHPPHTVSDSGCTARHPAASTPRRYR